MNRADKDRKGLLLASTIADLIEGGVKAKEVRLMVEGAIMGAEAFLNLADAKVCPMNCTAFQWDKTCCHLDLPADVCPECRCKRGHERGCKSKGASK